MASSPILKNPETGALAGPPRTAAQREASRKNGAASHGPVTATGRAISAMNATRHGLAAHCAILPGESPEEYVALVEAWVKTLDASSHGAKVVSARVADCDWRWRRLDRLEERVLVEGVESQLKKSDISRRLAAAQDAEKAIKALATMSSGITASVPASELSQVMPAVRRAFDLAESAEPPVEVLATFRDALNDLVLDSFLDISPAAFAQLGSAAEALAEALEVRVAEEEILLEVERERLCDAGLLFVDEKQSKIIERHRTRLQKEMEGHLRLLRELREHGTDRQGAPLPIAVDLRLVNAKSP